MIKETITIGEVIDFLNELSDIDAGAIGQLIEKRVICNEELANHPTVQVAKFKGDKNHYVGLLGILNGLFGVDEDLYGPIVASYIGEDSNGNSYIFKRREKLNE